MNLFNPPGTIRNPQKTILEWLEAGSSVAVLTLVQIEGNAPYPLGSQMVVNEHGQSFGQITGGCAEAALVDHALIALTESRDQTHRYGLRSRFFDIQLPCGSGIDVHFEVIVDAQRHQQVYESLIDRQPAQTLLETELGPFAMHYLPQPRALLFGQGPILESLANLTMSSGLEVMIVTQEPEQAKSLSAKGCHAVPMQELGDRYLDYCDEFSCLVSLFHEHDRETPILKQALSTDLFYIGALGSKRTHAARIAMLMEHGVDNKQIERINGPVGLNIHAETPEQIAVSILAQVVMAMPKQRDLPIGLLASCEDARAETGPSSANAGVQS